MENNKNYDLKLTTRIWDNDNHQLINYNNKCSKKKVFKINSSGTLSRMNDNIIFSSEENEFFKLLEITKNEENNKYYVNCGNYSKDLIKLSYEEASFLIYKSYIGREQKNIKTNFYKLNQGDIIKLGRIYIKLLDMQLEEENLERRNNSTFNNLAKNSSYNSSIIKGQKIIKGSFCNKYDKESLLLLSNDMRYKNKSYQKRINILNKSKIYNNTNAKNNNNFILPRINSAEELFMIKPKIKLKTKKEKKYNSNDTNELLNKNIEKIRICRICYGEESTKINPLLCPCTCKGSMKYIHYLCLKNWLNSKIESEIEKNSGETTIISYSKKDLCCELCKSQFPDYIRYEGILYNISFYKPKFKEFIMFETLRLEKRKVKYINIISLDNKDMINIGRSHDCEFSFPEISISRFHSIIHKVKGELYIEDNNSKFGTLILVQNDKIEINSSMPLKLQINRTYIKIKMDIPMYFSCCNDNTNNTENEKTDYQNQNREFLNVFAYFNIKDNNNINSDSENNSNSEENIDNNDLNNIHKEKKNKENDKIFIIGNEEDQTSEKNNYNNIKNEEYKNIENRNKNINCDGIKDKQNLLKNENIELLNNINDIQIYNKNNFNYNKMFNTNNSKSGIGIDDTNFNTSMINIKKNNINLFIEDINDINNKNKAKSMRKIKITDKNNLVNKEEEFLLPNIKNENIHFENFIKSSKNRSYLQQFKNYSLNPFENKNIINNNVFNISQPKIIINRNTIFNCFFNKNNSKLDEQFESLIDSNESENGKKV